MSPVPVKVLEKSTGIDKYSLGLPPLRFFQLCLVLVSAHVPEAAVSLLVKENNKS